MTYLKRLLRFAFVMGALVAVLTGSIVLAAPHAPFAQAMADWGFAADATGTRFTGPVPAAETFRFLGLLARYGSLIDRLALDQDAPRRS